MKITDTTHRLIRKEALAPWDKDKPRWFIAYPSTGEPTEGNQYKYFDTKRETLEYLISQGLKPCYD